MVVVPTVDVDPDTLPVGVDAIVAVETRVVVVVMSVDADDEDKRAVVVVVDDANDEVEPVVLVVVMLDEVVVVEVDISVVEIVVEGPLQRRRCEDE